MAGAGASSLENNDETASVARAIGKLLVFPWVVTKLEVLQEFGFYGTRSFAGDDADTGAALVFHDEAIDEVEDLRSFSAMKIQFRKFSRFLTHSSSYQIPQGCLPTFGTRCVFFFISPELGPVFSLFLETFGRFSISLFRKEPLLEAHRVSGCSRCLPTFGTQGVPKVGRHLSSLVPWKNLQSGSLVG